LENFYKKIFWAGVFIVVFIVVFRAFYNPTADFKKFEPGLDNRPTAEQLAAQPVNIGENFEFKAASESTLTGKWARFRGNDFDNISKENTALISDLKDIKNRILWQLNLGEGHSAPAIYNGAVYLMDYDEKKKEDVLNVLDLETGELLWKRSYKVKIKRNHGMSRTTPAVTEYYVLTLGPMGHVMCMERLSGKLLWTLDLVKEYKTEIPFWYTGQCPLIDNDRAILAPAGTALMIAVDCATGTLVWKSENPDKWKMSHSSVMPMEFDGKRMLVYAAIGGMVGIDVETGATLWKTSAFNASVIAPSPLVLPGGKFFMTAGYGYGSALFQLKTKGTAFEAVVLQQFKPVDGVASEQQTGILYQGKVYTILPKDAGQLRNRLVANSPDDFKKTSWQSEKSDKFGLGPFVIADGKMFIVDDDGTLTLAKMNDGSVNIIDQQRIIDGQDAWGPIAIADGYLIMRDSKKMVCLNVKK